MSTPPPCPERCWEWTEPNVWIYTGSSLKCGHYLDNTGRWRWAHGHPAEPVTNTESDEHLG